MSIHDTLSVLTTSDGKKATKTFTVTPFGLAAQAWGNPTFFDHEAVPVSNLEELSNLLTKLQGHPDKLVIRGALREGREATGIRRTCAGPDANFQSASHQWLCIDVDDFPIPENYGGAWDANEEAIVADLCYHLPKEFHNVNCHWHFSSSMGIKPGVRVHLWFWLSRPVSDEEAKAWLSDSKTPLDLSLYQTVQAHFTAAPIFDPPEKNPIGFRSSCLQFWSSSEVSVPDLGDRVATYRQKLRPRAVRFGVQDGAIELREIVRNGYGSVVDGREKFLFLKSVEACRNLTKGRKANDQVPEIEFITEETWRLFTAEADVADGKWTKADAYAKAAARHKNMQGGWSPNSRFETTTLFPDVEPFFESETLPKETAEGVLEHHLSNFFSRAADHSGAGFRQALRVTMGAGKTTKAITHLKKYLDAYPDTAVEIYVPRHDLAHEIVELLKGVDAQVEVVHIKGRGQNGADGAKLCQRYEYVQTLERNGLSVRTNACWRNETEKCEHYHGCAYWKQFRTDILKAGSVRIFPHAYLSIDRIDTLPEPQIVIIDEAFLSSVRLTETVQIQDVVSGFRDARMPSLGKEIVSILQEDGPLVGALVGKGIGDAELLSLEIDRSDTKMPFDARSNSPPTNLPIPKVRSLRALETLKNVLLEEMETHAESITSRVRLDPKERRVGHRSTEDAGISGIGAYSLAQCDRRRAHHRTPVWPHSI